MRARSITQLSIAGLLTVGVCAGSARADDLGPEPPSAPTPDEAMSAAAPTPAPSALTAKPAATPPSTPAPAAAATPAAPPRPAASTGASPDATNETYRTKDGDMYQPPATRPASPAMDRSHYGRT